MQEAVAHRIVDCAGLAGGEAVIEIGPGLGIMTGVLVAHPLARLTLVELDQQLAAGLEARFRNDSRVEVIQQDFLAVDIMELAGENQCVVIGNLPFNVATAILERLCGYRKHISRMVLMFQREVAERIRARPGTSAYSALSVFTALYWEVVDHFRVAAGSFYPRPKVDAEVLTFVPHPVPLFADAEENRLLETVRGSFSAPRKTIRNSLATGLKIAPEAAEGALLRSGIDPLSRPRTLSMADFVRLARGLRNSATSAGVPDA